MRTGDAQIDAMLKAQQWERAKGELRAFVAMQGSYVSGATERTTRWETLDVAVEAFIGDTELNGLHE
jgi:hypothetical protein